MKLTFWKSTPSEPPECAHDWMNWTDPEPATVPVYTSMFTNGEFGAREGLRQDRTCLKCNILQRRYI